MKMSENFINFFLIKVVDLEENGKKNFKILNVKKKLDKLAETDVNFKNLFFRVDSSWCSNASYI